MKNKKVVVLYRVIQEWRRPIFEKLAKNEGINFKLYHGPDFEESKVVSSKKKVDFKTNKLFSFKIRRESKNGLIAMPISPFLFFSLIKDNPDVVITEGASNLINAFIAFIYCKIFRKKYIWWSLGKLKGTEHIGFRAKIDKLITYIERHSDSIISYSSIGKLYFESIGVDSDKIYVAVNVIDTESKYEELKSYKNSKYYKPKSNKTFQVLFVGAMTPQKRIDMLIESYAEFEKGKSDVKLLIVGDGQEMNKLRQLAVDLQVKNIEFTGGVFDGVMKYFLQSDVFVLPGLGGLAVSESLLYGVPVIASIGDGCEKDLIDHLKNGIIDEELDSSSLARYISDLYSDKEKLEEMKRAAANKIKNEINIESYLNNIKNAIHS